MLGSYAILRSDSIISENSGGDPPLQLEPSKEEDNPNPGEISTQSFRKIWMPADVEKLISLRNNHPKMSWEELQETHFPDRTVSALKGKIWRITDSESKARKRSHSESSAENENENGNPGDIPFEGSHSTVKEKPGLKTKTSGEVKVDPWSITRQDVLPDNSQFAHTPQNTSRNSKPSQSTSRRVDSGSQLRRPTRNSLPSTGSFSAVNKPAAKRTRNSSIQLSDNEGPPVPSSADDSKEDSRVQLALQLLDPKLWGQIYDEARQCEPERRRAINALAEKAAVEVELRDVKLRLRKMENAVHKQKQGMHHSPMRELDVHQVRRVKAAWGTVINTCKDSISFTNWETAGMSEAVKVVQGEIDEMSKTVSIESPMYSDGPVMANGSEHDDHGDNVMGNLDLFQT